MSVISSYQCKCQTPREQVHQAESTGLCDICNLVYDEALYEMRLRQYVPGLPEGDLHTILIKIDPNYRAAAAAA